jgi:phospholipid/cholesterol/gamma-HCH transport system substrate-binding protein
MDDRVTQFRVGVLVVATCIIAGILIMLFGELPGFAHGHYTIFVRFPQAPAVTVDTPVKKSGILIGRVTDVDLLDDGNVVITAKINNDYKLRNNEVCRISTGNILGDAVLEFVPSGVRVANIDYYSDGEYLDGIVAQDPLSVMESATTALEMLANLEEDVRMALVSVEGAGQRVGDMAESLNSVIVNNQDQFQRIMGKAEQAMNRFDVAIAAIDEFIRDEDVKELIEQALEQVPVLLGDARDVMSAMKTVMTTVEGAVGDVVKNADGIVGDVKDTVSTVQTTVESFRNVSERAERNLQNLEGLTEPLGRQGEVLVQSIEGTVGQINAVLGQLTTFSQALNNRDGTLGQLIHNRELYDQINDTVRNIEYLSRQLRPIVNDARVFTDKVARDPGRLGVKGALDRRQSGTKR